MTTSANVGSGLGSGFTASADRIGVNGFPSGPHRIVGSLCSVAPILRAASSVRAAVAVCTSASRRYRPCVPSALMY